MTLKGMYYIVLSFRLKKLIVLIPGNLASHESNFNIGDDNHMRRFFSGRTDLYKYDRMISLSKYWGY